MRYSLPVLAIVSVLSLACGGTWNKAQARAWAELSLELDAIPEGPNRARVSEILDEAYLRTAENEIGFAELTDFRPKLVAAVEDGELDDEELKELEALASAWSTPPAGMAADRQAARYDLDCNFEKFWSYAYIWLRREAGAKPGGEQVMEFDEGTWEVDARGIDLDVSVNVKAPGVTLMNAMFSD